MLMRFFQTVWELFQCLSDFSGKAGNSFNAFPIFSDSLGTLSMPFRFFFIQSGNCFNALLIFPEKLRTLLMPFRFFQMNRKLVQSRLKFFGWFLKGILPSNKFSECFQTFENAFGRQKIMGRRYAAFLAAAWWVQHTVRRFAA